ncbi:MAG: PQQ-binding-like beta-propeller repeat protein [Verrucomicrobia bacterium]|nr:PQQ-binding-like beta-propeller repeat protein [Verrucomicrobiota bacterium]
MKLPCTKLTVVAAVLTAALTSLQAENWGNWRGPNYNGSTTEKSLPATFSRTENVLWTAPMPGPSGASPVVWDDYVFVSSTDDAAKTCVALAFDRKTGKELWRAKISDGAGRDRMSTFSNSSPVTDGKHVWFFYGNGELVCFEVAGKEVWRRNIEKDYGQFAFQWTFSTSPLLHDGRLYLQVLQRNVPVNGRGKQDGPNESYLLAMDPKTGKELWRVVRPSEAQQESLEAFSTPTPYTHNGREELLIVGGDCVSGHDPDTGKEYWRWGTWNPTRIGHWRLVPSPTAGAGVVLACGPKDSPVYAVKLGGKGTLTHKDLAWQSFIQTSEDPNASARPLDVRELSSDVPTPLFYEGKFYILNGTKKKLLCIEPDGKVGWSGDLKGKGIFQSTPTAADGKIYMMNFAGEVFVVQAGGSEFKLLHMAEMGEGENTLRAAIPISQGQLFVRTSKTLFAIGKK